MLKLCCIYASIRTEQTGLLRKKKGVKDDMVLSEKYQLIQKLAKDFAEAEIPSALQDEIDRTGEFPQELLKNLPATDSTALRPPYSTADRAATRWPTY